jgi:D-serine deaminase-like pyridoxal phosphate-dependent protein
MEALDLDTPALYVDLDVLERNIARMQEACRQWGVGLRPHAKTHKIAAIAEMQLQAGAIGITVAKVGEAEVLPGSDVLVAYPILKEKVARVLAIGETRRIAVAVDSVDAARNLGGIRALVEIDVGVGRAGVQNAVIAALAREGLQPEIVSGGSTPGAGKTPLVPQTTEIRPGTYVFYDASSLAANLCSEADCALRVLTTVVSTAVPGQCLIDGGSKTFSSDATHGVGTFGHFPGRAWTMRKMNEEHGYVEITSPVKIGEKVWVVPSHVCPTVNLHDEVWYGRNGRVEGRWTVTARGKVR